MTETSARGRSFDPSKPCTTRDGRPVRILCADAKGGQPICALVTDMSGDELVQQFNADGGFWPNGRGCNSDLINVPTKRKGWIGVAIPPIQRCDGIIADSSHVYPTEEEARRQTNFRTFIEIEFDE